MTPSLIRSAKTGSGLGPSLAITSPAAGNLLVMGMAQSVSVGEPVPKDNLGTTGWTLILTHAQNNTSANSTWIAYKVAVGTETELIPTVGSGGNMQGIWYEEWSGLAAELDGEPVHTDNQASGKTVTSPGVTTTDANSVVFAAVGVTASALGKISAWVPSGVVTIAPETSSRILGASHAPGSILTAQTYKAEWETAKTSSILVVAFKPSGGGTTPAEITFTAAKASAASAGALTAPANVIASGAQSTAATSGALSAPALLTTATAGAQASASGALSTPALISGTAAAQAAATGAFTTPGAALITFAPAGALARALGSISTPAAVSFGPAGALAAATGTITHGAAAIIAFGTVSAVASASGSFFAPQLAQHLPPIRRPSIGSVAVGDRGRLARQEGGRAT